MKAAPFEYVAAKTAAEASKALGSAGATTAAIAGGQSLLPMLNLRVALPDCVVDLNGIEELREVAVKSDTVRIGALATHAEIEDGLFANVFGGLMQRVASKISYRAIRHYGTIGGSVALADPAADWPGCLMALGATVRVSGLKGLRSEPVESFVQGQYQTSLAPDEIIVGFDVPRQAARLRWGVFKVVRKSGAFASSIAFAVAGSDGRPASVVLAAATTRPHLLPKVAEALGAAKASDETIRRAIAEDVAALVPNDDAYSMRLHTSTVLRSVQEMQRA